MKHEANVPCCACGSTGSDLLLETAYRCHRYPGTFAVRRCAGCGLLFNSPRLTEEEQAALYGRSYYFFHRIDAREFRRNVATYRRTVARVEGRVAERTVLEVGSAKGYLLALLKDLGWDVQGVEISPFAARYARDVLGVETMAGTIEDYVRSAGSRRFQVVLAIDVLEHVPRPAAFVAALGEAVADGGLLILDTPNGASANIAALGAAWKGFNPFHIYLFSPGNLARLLRAHGFVPEHTSTHGNAPCRAPAAVRAAHAALRAFRFPHVLRQWAMRSAGWLLRGEARLAAARRQAVAAARNGRGPLDSADARGPLAAGCRGDNLVVIARRDAAAAAPDTAGSGDEMEARR